MEKIYQKAVRNIEKELISKSHVHLALLVRLFNNLILNFVLLLKSIFLISKNAKRTRQKIKMVEDMGQKEKYLFASVELSFMIRELFPIINRDFLRSNLSRSILLLFEKIKNQPSINYAQNFKHKKVLIIGPGLINSKSIAKHDIKILLNPNLQRYQFSQNENFIIVLNKQNTERYMEYINELSSRDNILVIYTKIHLSNLETNSKIKIIDPSRIIKIAPTSGTPNLLQLLLFEICHWEIDQIQIVGCDLYLNAHEYRPGIKPKYASDGTNSVSNLFLSLSMHNPFAQLTFIKIFEVFFAIKGIKFLSQFNDLGYLNMAAAYKKKYNRSKPKK